MSTSERVAVGGRGQLVLVIKSYWGYGYFHAVVNEVQRFFLTCHRAQIPRDARFEDYDPHNDVTRQFCERALVFVSAGAPRIEEWLSALGVDPKRIIKQLPDAISGVLLAAGCPCGSFVGAGVTRAFAGAVQQGLRRMSSQPLSPSVPPTLLYFARPAGRFRSIANEADVFAWLREAWRKWHGSTLRIVVHTAEMTLSETFAHVQRARIIAGPHGSGLTHVLLATKRQSVIEFHESVYRGNVSLVTHICFAVIARQLSLPYSQASVQCCACCIDDVRVC
jgi:hypothetical protein